MALIINYLCWFLPKVFTVLAAVGAVIAVGVAVQYILKWKKSKRRKSPVLLENPLAKYNLPLIEKQVISHDTRRFRFGLPTGEHVLGLPTGQHVHLTAEVNGELVIRAYTPVSSDDDNGFVDLVAKVSKDPVLLYKTALWTFCFKHCLNI